MILRQYRHDEISSESTLVDALSALLRVTVTVLPFAIFKQFLINKKAKYQQKTYQYMALIKFKLKQTIISRTKIFIGCINISQNVWTRFVFVGSGYGA